MSSEDAIQENYAANADGYSQFIRLPLGALEQQLFDLSITDCDGLTVLDLGGGTGLRARDALRAGAAAVDVVDISDDMMQQGQAAFEADKVRGRESVKWFQADVSKPIDHLLAQGLRGNYDLVVSNGIFDHAHNAEELEAMWRNSAVFLKPGGRLVANRNNPRSKAAAEGKYGVKFTDFKDIPGGFTFRYNMQTAEPLVFDSVALDVYASGSLEIPGKFFNKFENVPWEQTPVVKADLEFWKEYLEDPILYIFTARKLE